MKKNPDISMLIHRKKNHTHTQNVLQLDISF